MLRLDAAFSSFKGKGEKHESKRKRVPFDFEKAIVSAVTKQVAETMKANEQAKTSGTKAEAYIMSIFKKHAAGKALVSNVTAKKPPAVPSSLKRIIQHAKKARSDWLDPATSKRRKLMKPESTKARNPGGDHNSELRNLVVKINVPTHLHSLLATVMASNVDVVEDGMGEEELSQTELDSHANMPVVGRHAHILSDTGQIADVNPFTPGYDSMQVPIVDAAVQHNCPYDGQSYIMVVQNALHVP
jgi:hypothetical protein